MLTIASLPVPKKETPPFQATYKSANRSSMSTGTTSTAFHSSPFQKTRLPSWAMVLPHFRAFSWREQRGPLHKQKLMPPVTSLLPLPRKIPKTTSILIILIRLIPCQPRPKAQWDLLNRDRPLLQVAGSTATLTTTPTPSLLIPANPEVPDVALMMAVTTAHHRRGESLHKDGQTWLPPHRTSTGVFPVPPSHTQPKHGGTNGTLDGLLRE